MIPPEREATNPQIERAAAFRRAYSALKAGKFFPKKTGKNDETIIPPKFLREEAMSTFLAHGRVKTTPMLSMKALMGFFFSLRASSASFAFFSASFYLDASSMYLPLSGSLMNSIVQIPQTRPARPIVP